MANKTLSTRQKLPSRHRHGAAPPAKTVADTTSAPPASGAAADQPALPPLLRHLLKPLAK